MLSEQDLKNFLERLASAAPTPGGGGAAAFNGAMAAALLSMVCNLTIGKEKFAEVEASMKQILKRVQALQAELTQMIDEDAAAVNSWLAAYRLPRASEAEKSARQAAIQAGAKRAIQSPLATAQACAELIHLARSAAKICNPTVVGDAQAAVICAEAGLKITAMNVLLNLESLDDTHFAAERRAELQQILADFPDLSGAVYSILNADGDD